MKKFWAEFRAFINRGSVMDLAVGMIIGSAFTAIITALVKNILTPLINAIPGSGATGALQTVLREAVIDANGNVVTEALILDWGSVISAIVTFIITALVLFLLVKAFNRIKETGNKLKEEIKNTVVLDRGKECIEAEDVADGGENAAADAKAAVEEAAVAATDTNGEQSKESPDYEKLLREIIELLKESKSKERK